MPRLDATSFQRSGCAEVCAFSYTVQAIYMHWIVRYSSSYARRSAWSNKTLCSICVLQARHFKASTSIVPANHALVSAAVATSVPSTASVNPSTSAIVATSISSATTAISTTVPTTTTTSVTAPTTSVATPATSARVTD